MKSSLLVGALIAAGCAATGARDPLEPATSLAAAESAFAAQSVRENARAAFLANFADDGVLVRNGWAPARPTLEAQPPAPTTLEWRPVHVEAARAGDLGISTGPWTLTPHDHARAPLHGQFVSAWRRTGESWQVIADIGIVNPGPMLAGAKLEARVAPAAGDGDAASLARAEQAFAQRSIHGGMREAMREHGSEDLRFYREGHAPWLLPARLLPVEAADESAVEFTVEDAQVSRSGDLGFARGTWVQPHEGRRGVWLRAWRREGGTWRVALAVANATP